jgi:hypothetical protein
VRMHWASVPLTDHVVDPEVEESHRALERQRKEDYESHVKDAHADIDTFQRAIETAGDELRPRGARKLNRLLRKNALTMYVPPDGDDDEDGAGGVAMKRAEEMVDVQRDRGDRAAQYLKDNPDASMDVGMGTLNHLMEPFVSRSSTVFDGDEADGLVVARATFPELDRLHGPSPLPPSRSLPSVASSASPARVISAPPAPLPSPAPRSRPSRATTRATPPRRPGRRQDRRLRTQQDPRDRTTLRQSQHVTHGRMAGHLGGVSGDGHCPGVRCHFSGDCGKTHTGTGIRLPKFA